MKAKLDDNGHELPDPTPLTLPSGFKRPETLEAQIQRLVRGAISRQAAESGYETFEDADDFDIPDDTDDPFTPYEMEFDPILGREVSPQMLKEGGDRIRTEYVQKAVDHPVMDEMVAKAEKKAARKKNPPSGGSVAGATKAGAEDPPDRPEGGS